MRNLSESNHYNHITSGNKPSPFWCMYCGIILTTKEEILNYTCCRCSYAEQENIKFCDEQEDKMVALAQLKGIIP